MAGTAQAVTVEEFAGWCDQAGTALTRPDFTVPLKRCGELIVSRTLENFADGHAPDGTPWLPLKHPRANSKGGDKPLRDTDTLMASVTAQGTGHVEELEADSLTFGTNVDYAAVHQWGKEINVPERRRDRPWVFPGEDGKPVFTRRIKAHTVLIPQRQFLGITEEMGDGMNLIFAAWAGEQVA